jgi:hypothetical protein
MTSVVARALWHVLRRSSLARPLPYFTICTVSLPLGEERTMR